ncbi:MAG TPA: response regulator [Stellaceae bacterium]|nr:response regulator [Stellaceae bacterium]
MVEETTLQGLSILVVEDVLLVAEAIGDGLESYGCTVVGPVARLEPALALAREAPLDGAVLDVNLAGRSSAPIAEILSQRGIPFVFVTGYGADTALPPEYRNVPRLTKPFQIRNLAQLASECFRPQE